MQCVIIVLAFLFRIVIEKCSSTSLAVTNFLWKVFVDACYMSTN